MMTDEDQQEYDTLLREEQERLNYEVTRLHDSIEINEINQEAYIDQCPHVDSEFLHAEPEAGIPYDVDVCHDCGLVVQR